MPLDELGIIEAAHRKHEQELSRHIPEQDLVVVPKGPTRTGRVMIGSVATGSIVGEVDVEILDNNVVVTVRRQDEAQFGPVSMVVV